jgi:hypothetical protein
MFGLASSTIKGLWNYITSLSSDWLPVYVKRLVTISLLHPKNMCTWQCFSDFSFFLLVALESIFKNQQLIS